MYGMPCIFFKAAGGKDSPVTVAVKIDGRKACECF